MRNPMMQLGLFVWIPFSDTDVFFLVNESRACVFFFLAVRLSTKLCDYNRCVV